MKFDNALVAFLKELGRFEYHLSGSDFVWNLLFPDGVGRWNHVAVIKYRQTFYINHIDGKSVGLEVVPGKCVQAMASFGFSHSEEGRGDLPRVWGPLVASARAWLRMVKKDWIRAGRRVQQYPLNRRFGIVPHSIIRACLPNLYRIDKELGKADSRKFVALVEDGYFLKDANITVESMTARQYFDYCRIAYIAGQRREDRVDEGLSGREMYERYADGRHEGLLDIDENSKQEFADWIDGKHEKKASGGHPWEIKRGGNTTHIDLSVFRPSFRKEGFMIELCGAAITRLAETIRMFLAISDASLPISIADPEGIRMRLLAQDNIGIVPCYITLHGANQHFSSDKHVYDVLHYDDLGRTKRRLDPFIAWEPLPLLKPREV
ncbi:MAG: hypothetical protein ABSH28_07340 [Acidobacteriota bacterium]|jgi:hypothetical protein